MPVTEAEQLARDEDFDLWFRELFVVAFVVISVVSPSANAGRTSFTPEVIATHSYYKRQSSAPDPTTDQNERVNGAQVVSLEIVEAARDSLVIGQA
jgi:hypothetical protein